MRARLLTVLALSLTACAPTAPAPIDAPTGSPMSSPTVAVSTAAPTVEETTLNETTGDETTATPPESPGTTVPVDAGTTPAKPAETAAPPTEPPPAPSAPAPSTAGGLTELDLATAEGWHPTPRPGGFEDGYLGNGTWVYATSAEHSAYAAIALGCAELRAYPQPTAALQGTLADDAGRVGTGLTLEFSSPGDAAAYFAEWVRQAEACDGSATHKLSATEDTWLGLRNLETVWSETVGLRGNTVRFLIVDSPDADLSRALDGAR